MVDERRPGQVRNDVPEVRHDAHAMHKYSAPHVELLAARDALSDALAMQSGADALGRAHRRQYVHHVRIRRARRLAVTCLVLVALIALLVVAARQGWWTALDDALTA